jgi:hypothetical protein
MNSGRVDGLEHSIQANPARHRLDLGRTRDSDLTVLTQPHPRTGQFVDDRGHLAAHDKCAAPPAQCLLDFTRFDDRHGVSRAHLLEHTGQGIPVCARLIRNDDSESTVWARHSK